MRRWLTIAVLLAATTAAKADWQYTRWGMTLDDLKVTRPDIIMLPPPNKDGQRPNPWGEALAKTTYKALNVEAEARFLFRAEQLTAVQLTLSDTTRADAVFLSMVAQYGAPTAVHELTDICPAEFTVWRNEETGNFVIFGTIHCSKSEPTVVLSYQPIPTAMETGL